MENIAREPVFNLPPATLILLLLLIALHVAVALTNFDITPFLVQPAVFWSASFAPQHLFTLMTYQFFHASWLHLAVNVGMLLAFGSAMERMTGPVWFPILYLICGALAALAQAAAAPDSMGAMLGASGAISGAMGFVLWRVIHRPKMRVQLFILMAVVQPVMALAAGTSLGGEIAWVAHLAGFTAGVIMAICWPKNLRPHD